MEHRIELLAKQWGFIAEAELPGGHCSKVYADATRVLKAPFRGEELESGFVAALRIAGKRGPRVFQSDTGTSGILMERLIPGTPVGESLPDEDALEITAEFARAMWCEETSGCLPLAAFVGTGDPLARELLATTEREVFLHGDLHQFNILRHGDRWVVIDPKGVVGDPAFEPTAFLRNPLETISNLSDPESILRQRIARFAQKLDLDPWRICAWSLVDVRSWADETWHRTVTALERIEKSYHL
ncbi:MAG: aminoglycoside phosphotransferase family protein [Fimbriimonadales bacterium]